MNRISFWSRCLLLLVVFLGVEFVYAQEAILLTPQQTLEQTLTGDQPSQFRLELKKGQFIRAFVMQNGPDLLLELFAANNQSLLKRNLSSSSWEDSLAAEVPADGNYFLTIKSSVPLRGTVKFTVRLETQPSVTNKEQAILDAEEAMQEAFAVFEPLRQGGRILRDQFEAANETAWRKRQQALPLYQLAGDRAWEAYVLYRLCTDSTKLEQREQAVKYGEQALAIWREKNDRVREVSTMTQIGLAWFKVTNINSAESLKREEPFAQKAIPWHEQALAIRRERNDKSGIGDSLMRLGEAYACTAQKDRRFEFFEQALIPYREAKDLSGQRLALTRLGNSYRAERQLDKAVTYYEEALKLSSTPGLPDLQLLDMLLEIYAQLENYDKSIEYIEKRLMLSRSAKLLDMEASSLRFLSESYREKKIYAQALEYAEKGLAFARENKIRNADGSEMAFRQTLANISLDLGQPEKAIALLKQELPFIQKIKSVRFSPAGFYATLGKAYRLNKQYDESLEFHLLAIHDLLKWNLQSEVAAEYAQVMLNLQAKGQPDAAIFWGKQAINLNQDVRRSISGLDEKTRQDFLKAREEAYRNLADLLISLGRLPEAEQIIRMLKEEEYYEYVRRDDNNAPTNIKTALTPEEAAMEKRFREIADNLIEIGEQRSSLLAKPARSTEEETQLTKVETDLGVANQKFQKFLETISVELSKKTSAQQTIFQLRESQGLMEDLRSRCRVVPTA